MPRRPTQLPLPLKPRFKHGGRREGAGRPKTSALQPHSARREFSRREPLHLTLRLRDGLPSLQRKSGLRCLKHAVRNSRTKGLAITHFAILSNHIHLIVESSGKRSLARQMQSFGISLAKRINQVAKTEGSVLRERYHVRALKTPREVKNALTYVLTNEFKHRGSKERVELNEHSSAILLSDDEWSRLLGSTWNRVVGFPPWEGTEQIQEWVRSLVTEPSSWLLTRGWKRAAPA